MTRTISIPAAVLLACGACAFAQGNSSASHAASPAARADDSLPHDTHEGLSVSADAYTDVARAKEKFGKASPIPVGILPVEVFLRNETNQPMRVDLSAIQLTVQPPGGRRQDIDSVPVQEVASTVAHPKGPSAPQSRRFPIGIGSVTDSKTDKMLEVLRPLSLDADAVPPMGVIHGFLFFDLDRDLSLASEASLYVPDVSMVPSQKALMFFEVALGKSSRP
jgi:hypothetical protein